MHLLAATVPDVEVPRADVVATRLARKVAPLFGIVWEQSPFGCTWVCDFGALTLAEIARGAPYPARDVQSAMDADADADAHAHAHARSGTGGGAGLTPGESAAPAPWRFAGRAVWTPQRRPTPGAITHATLNRYGPDTKAAVVLTGANRLLRDVTAGIAAVCRSLADRDTAPEIRLAVWAGLVLEAFRGQPALVAAAVQARQIQRALTVPWGERLLLRGLEGSARCEFGAGGGAAASPQHPTRFELVDATLPLLRLPVPVSDGPLFSQAEILEDIAGRWCRRLLQVGHPGRGITWVAADPPGHRRVQSYVRIGSAVAPFVADVLAMLSIPDGAGERVCLADLPWLLSGVETAGHGAVARRAYLVGVHALTSYLRFHDGLLLAQPELRRATRQLCDRGAAAAGKWLGADDPASVLLAGYAAYLHAWDLGRELTADVEERTAAAAELVAQLDRVTAAWRDRLVDPGTASYLLEIGAVALDRVGVPSFRDRLPGLWRAAMTARGIDPRTDLDDPLTLPGPQQYHLQNYAAYLAAAADSTAGLRRALAAQRACVSVRDQVTQGEPAVYDAKFTSARTSRQAAAAIAGRLLRALRAEGGGGTREYGEVLAEGVAHARAAIENPTTALLLGGAHGVEGGVSRDDPEVVRLAIAVLPALADARERQGDSAGGAAVLVDDALLAAADALLAAAAGSAGRLGAALPDADRAVLADLSRRGEPGRAA